MTIAFTDHAWEDYLYWQENDRGMLIKVNDLLKDIRRDAFHGKGKPEPLKGNFAGYWSRRISGEHRLVYRLDGSRPNQVLTIVQIRFHY